jgi:hypothetical protein
MKKANNVQSRRMRCLLRRRRGRHSGSQMWILSLNVEEGENGAVKKEQAGIQLVAQHRLGKNRTHVCGAKLLVSPSLISGVLETI